MKAPLLRVLLSSVLAIAAIDSAFGQSERRATVMTNKGDAVEGLLRAITTEAVTLEVAGQPIAIKLSDVKYVSFAGKLEATGGPAPAAPVDRVTGVFAALKPLRDATQVGVLREQYSSLLISSLAPLNEFIASPQQREWAQVKAALATASSYFRGPMETIKAWSDAPMYMTEAARWSTYAEDLSKRPNESSYWGSTDLRRIALGGSADGRLAIGDAIMKSDLDYSSSDALNDVFMFDLPSRTDVVIRMTCLPCRPHLTLQGANGKKIEGDAGTGGISEIKRTLEAGSYNIWAGTFNALIGDYTLVVTTAK